MKKYLFVFFILLLGQGCRKKDPDAIRGVYLFPQEVKDYTLFLPGTYWVYEDSISGIEDCVFVKNISMGIDTIASSSNSGGKEVVEFFGYETARSYDNYTYYYSSNTSFHKCIDENRNEPCFWTNREKWGPGNYVGGGFCFLYEFYDSFCGYTGYGNFYSKITILKHWPNLTLDNVVYNSIVEFYDDKNITENNNRTNFFFAKNIGIVRKELLDSNQTWNLIRYNIVQ